MINPVSKAMSLPLIIALICFVVFFVFGAANQQLAFNQQNFHLWQLLSAHFVHYDFKHLILNMLALVILLYLFPVPNKDLIKGFVLSMVLIDAYLLFSGVYFYIGFSGLLYVIPGLATGQLILAKKYDYAILIILAYLVYTGISFFSVNISIGILWKPLKVAHFFGFVSGCILKLIKPPNLHNASI
jgi:membrane associated rhomboid family serine protease